ncbi:hypothetical protein CRM22_001819 [Opisthorchis felineus]|uniref:Sorting nexin n=1 Tax=Opisthorchis felineus TaxID=147828 RepID=A0A4S2M8U5_OPIFE|nr:hypothetical protein CRM22_001819 [Opisthorchis felineus]
MKVRVIFDFAAQSAGELSIISGEQLTITDQTVGDGWWSAINSSGQRGLVPCAFVEPIDPPEPNVPPPPPPANLQQTEWDEEWDSDDSNSTVPTTYRSGKPNDAVRRCSELNQAGSPVKSQFISTGIAGSPAGESVRFTPVRKAFTRSFIKSGAEEFLLQLETPSVHTEAVIEFRDEAFCWRPSGQPIQCKILSFHKDSKMKGMKSFIAYQLTSPFVSSHVNRRYKHFDWLHARLVSKFPCICIPSLPDKAITGRYEDDFLEERRKQLQQWLDRMCRHPVVSQCSVFKHFLSCTDAKHGEEENCGKEALTGKEHRWKQGKREAETDHLQGARFFFAINTEEPVTPADYSLEIIDSAEKLAADLERGVRVFAEALVEFHRRMTTCTSKDFLAVSSAFLGVCRAINCDIYDKNRNMPLFAAFSNTGDAFRSLSVYHAVQSEPTTQLLECVREHARTLATLPAVVGLGKAACVAVEEARRLLTEGKLSQHDAESIQSGAAVIVRSVQAECVWIMQQLRQDFLERVKDYLLDRAAFCRQYADQLQSAASFF